MANAVTKAALHQFRPVQLEFGKIHMKGGHSAKALPMTSRTVEGPDRQNVTFVKMATTELWLISAVTGSARYSASSFGRTSLLDDMHARVSKLCDGDERAEDVPQDDDYDPMAEVEQADEAAKRNSKTYGQGNKRTRYYKKTNITHDMEHLEWQASRELEVPLDRKAHLDEVKRKIGTFH